MSRAPALLWHEAGKGMDVHELIVRRVCLCSTVDPIQPTQGCAASPPKERSAQDLPVMALLQKPGQQDKDMSGVLKGPQELGENKIEYLDDIWDAAEALHGQDYEAVEPILDRGAWSTVEERPVRKPDLSRLSSAKQSLHGVLASLKSGEFANQLPQGLQSYATMSNEQYLASIQAELIDPNKFTAGYISEHRDNFQTYFKTLKVDTADTRKVLNWLQRGVGIHWTNPYSKEQQAHPRFKQKLAQVRALLEQHMPKSKVEDYLQGEQPKQIHFKNRVSVDLHTEFVKSEIEGLLESGVLRKWNANQQIQVINGLGVAKNRAGKLRLILDARYINAFDRFVSFSYEKLGDVPGMIQQGDYMVLTDHKSGYHQLKMAEETYTFLGVSFQGQVYHFAALPFGLSSACRTYTILMKAVYSPLRKLGQRMTFLIDDACFVFPSWLLARYRGHLIIKLMSALGFVLSFQKCVLLPTQVGKFLGLQIDTVHRQFLVPKDKLQYTLDLIDECLQKSETNELSSRNAARFAGVMLSLHPAVHMAPLYTRLLFSALQTSDWDAPLLPLGNKLAVQDLQFWKSYLPNYARKSWIRRDKVFKIFGDVSETVYAGYTEVDNEVMVHGFSNSEYEAMLRKELSSTLREVKCARLNIESALQAHSTLSGSVLLYHGDNQSAIFCLNHMKGCGAILEEVKLAYRLSLEHDVHLEFVWLPRTSEQIQKADALSRVQDDSSIVMKYKYFEGICNKALPGSPHRVWGHPCLDVFAGPNELEHKARKFFSRHHCVGTLGVNAFNHPWQMHVSGGLVWCFPPFGVVSETIAKIRQEQVDTILIVPQGIKSWTPLLQTLPVIDKLDLPEIHKVCDLGAQVPEYMRSASFKLYLRALLVKF